MRRTSTAPPRTARQLAAALAPYSPAASPAGLEFDPAPPGLEAPAGVLKSGVVAVLTGARWFGCDGSDGWSVLLSPDAPVPAGITLLTVEGAACWDRLPSAARLDFPDLFDPPDDAPPARKPRHGRRPALR